MSGNDPEETMPFTHRPFGAEEPVDPATAPEGAASQPSGADFVPPSVAPPPMASPMASPPYGPPQGTPASGWGVAPTYPAYAGQQKLKIASTSMTLGIISLVSAGLALLCCVTLPGVFCAPFAWVLGVRARREIDANPGVYGNRGQADAGVVMGIIGTVLSALVVVGVILFVALLASWNWTLV